MTRAVLDNGLTVLIQEDRSSPLVSLGMMYAVGARNEAAGSTGLAHYVEHMNFRATRGLPGHEITESITRLGGRWSGYTWIDQTYYAESVPREAFEQMLELEAERMTAALHDSGEFEQERSSVIAELHSYDDPESLLYDAVLAASFEIHPYRNNTIGWLSDVATVTRDDAFAFYRRFYHPRNAVLAIVGDVDPGRALESVRARLGAITHTGASSAVRTVEPPQTGQRRVVVRRPGPHARAMLAFRAPALVDADFATMLLLDALLAGGKGAYFTRDYAQPRDNPLQRATLGAGLASSAGTKWQASLYPYVYSLAADTATADGLAALEHALFELLEQAGKRPWSDAELAAARRQIQTGWALDLDDMPGRVHQLAFFEVSGGYRHLFELPARLERVTRDELEQFVRQRLQPHQATVGWFVPESAPAAPARSPASAAEQAEPPANLPAPAGAVPATALKLDNGLRVILAPRPNAGLLALRGRIESGSRHDPPDLAGLSALATEWLATPRPGEPSGLAGLRWTLHQNPESPSNLRFVEFEAAGLPDDLPALLELLAGRLGREAPAEEDWTAVLGAARERARQLDATPQTALWRSSLAALFPRGSPLAAPAWGDPDSLAVAEARGLRAFLAAHVTPPRTTLVVAGQLDSAAARRALAATLGRWTAPRVPEPRPRPLSEAQGPPGWTERALRRPEKAQNEIRVVWPGDRSQPWDRIATEVLLYLLGETGYAGRLGRALVERGLVYSVYATLEQAGTPGFLMIRTAAAPEHTAEVLRRIREVIEDAASGRFSQAELTEALGYRRGKRARSREGTTALAADLLEDAGQQAASAAELTLSRLNDTARRLLQGGAPLALVAGPGPFEDAP